MISAGELKVPPKVDYLYVEQEVMADETAAVDAVLKADKALDLVQEEKQLLEDLKKGPGEAGRASRRGVRGTRSVQGSQCGVEGPSHPLRSRLRCRDAGGHSTFPEAGACVSVWRVPSSSSPRSSCSTSPPTTWI